MAGPLIMLEEGLDTSGDGGGGAPRRDSDVTAVQRLSSSGVVLHPRKQGPAFSIAGL